MVNFSKWVRSLVPVYSMSTMFKNFSSSFGFESYHSRSSSSVCGILLTRLHTALTHDQSIAIALGLFSAITSVFGAIIGYLTLRVAMSDRRELSTPLVPCLGLDAETSLQETSTTPHRTKRYTSITNISTLHRLHELNSPHGEHTARD